MAISPSRRRSASPSAPQSSAPQSSHKRRHDTVALSETAPHKRPGVFGGSGLTDVQRRELRGAQRHLHEQLAQGDAVSDDSWRRLHQARHDNNVLFDRVRFTREAVLDADNVNLIANQYVLEVDRMVQVCFCVCIYCTLLVGCVYMYTVVMHVWCMYNLFCFNLTPFPGNVHTGTPLRPFPSRTQTHAKVYGIPPETGHALL
jgi:hypothetical protein